MVAPATLTTTLTHSMSRGMSESGQRRDTASCAALRRIGSRKLPVEARRSARSPVGVVDVAAVWVFRGSETDRENGTDYVLLGKGVLDAHRARPFMALRRCSNAFM